MAEPAPLRKLLPLSEHERLHLRTIFAEGGPAQAYDPGICRVCAEVIAWKERRVITPPTLVDPIHAAERAAQALRESPDQRGVEEAIRELAHGLASLARQTVARD